jgi:hypothetical protein
MDKIKRSLSNGPKTNKELRAELTGADPKLVSKLDRDLQKGRKAGTFKVIQRKWALSTVQTCPCCKGKGWVDGSTLPPPKKGRSKS